MADKMEMDICEYYVIKIIFLIGFYQKSVKSVRDGI